MKMDSRLMQVMLRRAEVAAMVNEGAARAFTQLAQICHPEVLAWAGAHAAKQHALIETCVALPTRLWACRSLTGRAQRTYEIRRRENAAADRHVRALLYRRTPQGE